MSKINPTLIHISRSWCENLDWPVAVEPPNPLKCAVSSTFYIWTAAFRNAKLACVRKNRAMPDTHRVL